MVRQSKKGGGGGKTELSILRKRLNDHNHSNLTRDRKDLKRKRDEGENGELGERKGKGIT